MLPKAKNYTQHAALWPILLCLTACGGSSGGGAAGSGTTTGPTSAGGTTATSAGTGAKPSGTAGSSTAPTMTAGKAAPTTPGGTAGSTGGILGTSMGGTTATPAAGGAMAQPSGGGTAPPPAGNGTASVLGYHKNPTRDGNYIDAAFTRAAAAGLKKDATFTASVTGKLYAQPLYFEGGPGGADLIITATEQNEVSAFNAADGKMVWRTMLGAPVSGGLPCGNITPLGVTGTPVIDAASKTLFVAAMTSGPKHQIYALGLDDGKVKDGWPADVSKVKSAAGVAFDSSLQNQRGALVIANGNVYVPYGGHFGDCGNYHGWVVGVPMTMPSAPFGFATKASAGGIWAPGGLATDGTSIFAATGNTAMDGGGLLSSPATWGHGNAVLKLSADLKDIPQSQTTDFFAAENWSALDRGDLDVGGSGPILVSVPGATPSDLAVALGKGGGAYLIDRTKLGGIGGELQMLMVSSGGISGGMIQAAASWTSPTGTFVAFRSVQAVMACGAGSGNLGALKITAGSPPKMAVAWCAGPAGNTSPIVTTTDGSADSIVWYIAGGKLLGFNGDDGSAVFTGSDSVGTVVSFQTPIVAKGRMFIAATDKVVAYTLK